MEDEENSDQNNISVDQFKDRFEYLHNKPKQSKFHDPKGISFETFKNLLE